MYFFFSRRFLVKGFFFILALGTACLSAGLIAELLLQWKILKVQSRENPEINQRLKLYSPGFVQKNPDKFSSWRVAPDTSPSLDEKIPFIFKPNLRLLIRRGSILPLGTDEEANFRTNEIGILGSHVSVPKENGVLRIVCFGASTTQGSFGWKWPPGYPSYLQKELEAQYPGRRFEVINAGFEGHSLDSHLEVLRTLILPLQPDFVIYLDHVNNMQIQNWLDPNSFKWQASTWYRRFRKLSEKSKLYSVIKDRTGLAFKGDIHNVIQGISPSLEVYRGFLQRMKEYSDAGGTALVVVPAAYAKPLPWIADKQDWKKIAGYYFNTLKEFSKAQDLFFCDPTPVLTDHEELFEPDGIHHNLLGNEKLAGEIGKCLRQKFL